MKATFTLATPRPGEVVSGVEIEVDGIAYQPYRSYFEGIEGYTPVWNGQEIVYVKETPEEVRQIIEATKAKSTEPNHRTDDT